MRTHFLLFVLCLGLGTSVLAQNSVISGTVTDPDGRVVGATVKILQNNNLIKGANTDIDGFYYIGGLTSGTYCIEISLVGYEDPLIDTITLAPGQIVTLDRGFIKSTLGIKIPVKLNEPKRPTPKGGITLSAEQIALRGLRQLCEGVPRIIPIVIAETKEHPIYKQANSIDGIILKSDFISKHPTRMW